MKGKIIVRDRNNRLCPAERAGMLDNKIRRWIQSPQKILAPYIEKGMVVLDIGCGPGFFSIDMAKMVGKTGRVIAADLQERMLEKVKTKIQATELQHRITLHKCEENKIGVSEHVDFVLLFYVIHEVPNIGAFFSEIEAILKPNGQVFMVEPPFHVSKKEFDNTIKKANDAGLIVIKRPKLFLGKAVILKRADKALV